MTKCARESQWDILLLLSSFPPSPANTPGAYFHGASPPTTPHPPHNVLSASQGTCESFRTDTTSINFQHIWPPLDSFSVLPFNKVCVCVCACVSYSSCISVLPLDKYSRVTCSYIRLAQLDSWLGQFVKRHDDDDIRPLL